LVLLLSEAEAEGVLQAQAQARLMGAQEEAAAVLAVLRERQLERPEPVLRVRVKTEVQEVSALQLTLLAQEVVAPVRMGSVALIKT
jgi:hypothetical protein